MGCKRPFEDMGQEELSSYKLFRQLELSNKINPISNDVSCYKSDQKTYIQGENEGGVYKLYSTEIHEKDIPTELFTLVEKDLENSNPLSWVTSSSGEEDVDSGASVQSHVHSRCKELDFTQRIYVPSNVDVFSSSLIDSPRRHIPIGPNHQASIPAWSGCKNGKELDQTPNRYSSWSLEAGSVVDCDNVERLMGTCIIPMPDSNSSSDESYKAGIGRNDCGCLDADSLRCVRQHIMDRRMNLREILGFQKFVNLGFSLMGEEVANKWSEDEELAFHEIVYSNPASLCKNFWKVLSAAFPSRSKMELASYYFNVFMLRKRAAQNRSKSLDIDSDDDEWHGKEHSASEALEPEVCEDSDREYLLDRYDQLGDEVGISEETDDDDDDDDGDDNGGGYVDDYVGLDSRDFVDNDGVIDDVSEALMSDIVEGRKGDSVYKISGSPEWCGLQDDSCMSFECEPNMPDSCDRVDLEASEIRSSSSKYLYGKPDTASSEVDYLYFSPCDAKVWDDRFYMGSAKAVDLLPTWNMIEDIFAQGMDDKETKDD